MLEFRLKSFEAFKKLDMPKWGPDLSGIDFNDIVYYQKPSAKAARSWEDVPQEIKDTFEKKLVFQKLNVHIWQELLLNMNQKLFIII